MEGSTEKPTVSTYLTDSGLDRPDGFALDARGNLYVANWGGGRGKTVLKIDKDGNAVPLYFTFDAPDAVAVDRDWNVYVSNYNSGVISILMPRGGKSDFASGLKNPSAIAIDRDQNLYVSNFGGGTVSKITPRGVVSTFAEGFKAPLGLSFDARGDLFVADYQTGQIHRVGPDGMNEVFARVPNPESSKIQYLALGKSGALYLPSYGHNVIYKIAPQGAVSVFAGTGTAGGRDGALEEAEFDGPNSIVISDDGSMFVSEYNANRIRVIRGGNW